jgi:hypothetical protein
MKKTMYKLILLAGITFCGAVLLSSCSKDDNTNTSTASKDYFVNNMQSLDLKVSFASDNGTDITSKFSGYTFRFADTIALAGKATASNDLLTVSGTWSIDGDYNKIAFVFPTAVIADLAFMNKQWQFTNRDSATVKLMASNGENDVLYFVRK